MPRRRKTPLPNVAGLRLAVPSRLESLPPRVLRLVFSCLGTAQSVARLARTCKALHQFSRADGWHAFVSNSFDTLELPPSVEDDQWMDLAQRLTSQSRAWDRRAFSLVSFTPAPKEAPYQPQPHDNGHRDGRGPSRGHGRRGGRHGSRRGGQGGGRGGSMQTFPPQVIVDARSRLDGRDEEETVAWGAGEDVVVRRRQLAHNRPGREKWDAIEGSIMGFQSGVDDVTAVSILGTPNMNPALLVGRASGHLQLLSMDPSDFGRPLAWFQTVSSEVEPSIQQTEVRNLDTSVCTNSMAVVSKDNLFLYPLLNTWPGQNQRDLLIEPKEGIDIRNLQNSQQFRYLQQVRFMGNGDIALGVTHSPAPLRFLARTPTGCAMINAAKMQPSRRCTESYLYKQGHAQTLRSLLPVKKMSVAGGSGSGSVILSSYDDGTIRLQDLRTSSDIDTIYQDHFEVTDPVGPLLSYGTERFLVGSARAPILKIFDFRWPKKYYYTDALPCGSAPLGPTPKPLTWIPPPSCPERERCSPPNRSCRLHLLARTTFYRPNCNVYLPAAAHLRTSPVYSLAKPSDASPVVYAGLAGELVKMSLSDDAEADNRESSSMQEMGNKNRCGYGYRQGFNSFVETSDGIALSDISKSQRLPVVYKQRGVLSREFGRLDETLTSVLS